MTNSKTPAKKPPVTQVTPAASPGAADLAEDLTEDQIDLFAAHAQAIHATILDLVTGIKVGLKVPKKNPGPDETLEVVTDTDHQTWYVYTQPPVVSLLKFVAEQLRGRAGTKTLENKAGTVIVQLAIPGHNQEIDAYLASLPPEKLKAYLPAE